jgi:uncharacterized membrane-anchored protein
MQDTQRPFDSTRVLSKVPAVTLAFWVVKICATTLGETGGDALSMSFNLGYAISTLVFLAFFAAALVFQLGSKAYHPLYYWLVVVATTTVGTTTSDYIDRTLGLGYVVSSIGLLALVIVILLSWRTSTGSIRVDHIGDRKNETFYWLTILVSNTLGTALGDFVADSAGVGFEKGALIFSVAIGIVAVLYYSKVFSEGLAFWAAYVLTRPLGATLGDTLTKPVSMGGFNFSRVTASAVIGMCMIILIAVTHLRRPARLSDPGR